MVRKLRKASYAEVVGYWISYEYADRKDFRDYINSHFSNEDIRFITEPHDYEDQRANSRRLFMLRGYRRFIGWFNHAEWWVASLSEKDISNLLVIHSLHWDLLSSGSVRALDIARGIEEKRWKKVKNDGPLREPAEFEHIKTVAKEESAKIVKGLKKKVKSKSPSRIVVIGADGGKDLTVIDGVHRVVRLCLYYFVRGNGEDKYVSQEAYVGFTPDPLQRYAPKHWQDVRDFFDRDKPQTRVREYEEEAAEENQSALLVKNVLVPRIEQKQRLKVTKRNLGIGQ